MSPSTKLTPPAWLWAMRSMRSSTERRLFNRLSSMTTSCPAASSSTQVCEPM
jgi:hypothetical protein